MKKNRYTSIDRIKIFACLLVLLGHFFQSMTKSDILPKGELFVWFNRTVYYFHVQLFFVCSGFLYQRFKNVRDIISWKNNVTMKAVALGVPYITFSLVTWLLKIVFPGSVNTQAGGLLDILFFHPIDHYWYLYTLFFLFVVTPTFKDGRTAVCGFILAALMKLAMCFIGGKIEIYAVEAVLGNEIWFVGGMLLCFLPTEKGKTWIGALLLSVFFCLDTFLPQEILKQNVVTMLLSMLAVSGFVIVFWHWNTESRFVTFFSHYTLPIYLMHTLFAAPLRTVLSKLHMTQWMIQVPLGIFVAIAGPICAAMIMEKTVWLNFFIDPWKVIKKLQAKQK